MQDILVYLNTIWSTYPIEFIMLIISSFYLFLRTINDILPPHLKINKRIKFLKKIASISNEINVSVLCNKAINPTELMTYFGSYWNDNTKVIRQDSGLLIFKLLSTGTAYTIQLNEADNPEQMYITVQSNNGFKIGKFGGIVGLVNNIDELQEIIELFSAIENGTPKIITTINLTLREKDDSISKAGEIIAKINGRNFSIVTRDNHIKITTNGFSSVTKIIQKAIRYWIRVYL